MLLLELESTIKKSFICTEQLPKINLEQMLDRAYEYCSVYIVNLFLIFWGEIERMEIRNKIIRIILVKFSYLKFLQYPDYATVTIRS